MNASDCACNRVGEISTGSPASWVHEQLEEVVSDDSRLLVNDDEIADEPLHRLDDIVRLAEHWATQREAGLIVVDYMQLAGTGRADEVAERVTQISRAIRGVAKSKNVVTVGLGPFNHGTSGTYHAFPRVQACSGPAVSRTTGTKSGSSTTRATRRQKAVPVPG